MDNGAALPNNSKPRADASRVLVNTKRPVSPIVARQAFRVLQTAQAPAQMSLFLRPGTR